MVTTEFPDRDPSQFYFAPSARCDAKPIQMFLNIQNDKQQAMLDKDWTGSR